jgi:hypothetical protein
VRSGVGITRQSSEILKDAVLAKQLGRLDAVQPEQHKIEQRQKHLPDTVAIVALRQPDVSCNRILESNSGEESMQQVHPAIVGEAQCTEFYSELPRSSWLRPAKHSSGASHKLRRSFLTPHHAGFRFIPRRTLLRLARLQSNARFRGVA